MSALNLNRVEFVKSAAEPVQFINDQLPKIVFAGKSNVGKSSVINRLLNRNNFARVGATPGKTVHVNYFKIDGRAYFVDLPGYGFAKAPESDRLRWSRLMETFFADTEIALGLLIVDSRHAPTADDLTMCDYFKNSSSPFAVIANKTDKLKKSEIDPSLASIRKALDLNETAALIPFSAEKGAGREDLIHVISDCLR